MGPASASRNRLHQEQCHVSDMLPIIYVARHGETAWSLTGQHTGRTDLPLTEHGEHNARSLAPRLQGVARLIDALHPDDIVLGGGNSKKLKYLPPGCRIGDNANAFLGGFRLWEDAKNGRPPTRTKVRSK